MLRSAPSPPAKWIRWFWIAAITSLFLVSQRFALVHVWQIWNCPDHYYAHGPLAPILAGIMVWMNRGRLRQAKITPSPIGVILAAVAVVFQIVGAALGFEELSGFALLLMLYAVVIGFFGARVCRTLFWPILFLATVIPLPQITLDSFTARYQLLSSLAAAKVLWLADHSIVANGNVIVGERLAEPLIVGPACSGLRISMTLVMCVFFLVYSLQGSWRQKAALAFAALPIGAAINGVRIAIIGLAAIRSGSAHTVSVVHNTSGSVGIAACSVLLLSTAWLSGMRTFRDPDSVDTNPDAAAHPSPTLAVHFLMITLLVASALTVDNVAGIYSDLPKGFIDRTTVPLSLAGRQAMEMPIDTTTRTQLNRADLLSLVYSNPSVPGATIYVLVDSAVDINMLHDPRLCLIGEGGRVTGEQIVRLRSANPKLDGAHAWLLRTDNSDGQAVMLCVYRVSDAFLPTKDAVNGYTARTRLADMWKLVRNPASLNMIRHDARARQVTWYRFVIYSGDAERDSKMLQSFAERFINRQSEMK
jgi:exosortase